MIFSGHLIRQQMPADKEINNLYTAGQRFLSNPGG